MEIIYEDQAIIVCYKPAGIATETKRIGQQDMVSLLKNYRVKKKEEPYVGMVHRLDQPVEGQLVFGKTKTATADLSKQVQTRSIGKYYYAVGRVLSTDNNPLSQEGGTLTDYILFQKKTNVSSIVSAGTPQAKKAVLDYRILGETEGNVCFDIALHTGRHHQIRLQMAHHGYPLIGDSKYGTQTDRGTQLALCSYRLQFIHPTTGENMDFSIRPHNPVFAPFL